MASRSAAVLPLLALLLLALLLPTAAAAPYEGPGQQGVVPVGEGGLTIPYLAGTADDLLFVVLEDIPEDACRLVLDENGTYAGTGITWAPGDARAYLWADPGRHDAPYRLHATWTTDIKGNCTVERTETEVHWHDPEGRPYVELRLLDDKSIIRSHAGTEFPIRFTVQNNGTISDNVTVKVAVMKDTFRISSTGPVMDVPIDAGETVTFDFAVDVPRDTKPGRFVVQVNLASDGGWRQAGTAILEVQPPVGEEPAPSGISDPGDQEPLPPPSIESAEAPVPFLVTFLAVAFALYGRRDGR